MGKSETVLPVNDSFCCSCNEKERQQGRFEVVLWPLETVYGRKYSSLCKVSLALADNDLKHIIYVQLGTLLHNSW